MKVNNQFWLDRANKPGVGYQDAEVIALRKMGYSGTLNDMRRAFYMDITGITDLTTAKARAKNLPDYSDVITFAGKARGDGDDTRIMKYGSYPELMNPDGFTSEVGGGYGGAAYPDDGSTAYWSINTPTGYKPQFCNYLSLNLYGTRDEVLKMMKSLKARVFTYNSEVYAFNNSISLWDKKTPAGASFEYVELELIDRLNDYVDSNNVVKIGVICKDAADGTNYATLEVDYFELIPTFFKSMP